MYAEIDIKLVRHKQNPRKIPLYKKGRWDSMKTDMSLLLATIQHKVLVGADVNQTWDTFTDNLQESITTTYLRKVPTQIVPEQIIIGGQISKIVKHILQKRFDLSRW